MGRLSGIKVCAVIAGMGVTSFGMLAQTLTTLHNFSGARDGGGPYAGVVQGSDGNLYGTTTFGGTWGGGSAFRISPYGAAFTELYTFCQNCSADAGVIPYGGLLGSSSGEFYGTTKSSGCCGGGAVYAMTSSGTASAIYGFCSLNDCTDGKDPQGGLILGAHGTLYGTTTAGGTAGKGTVFGVTLAGELITLHSFCAQSGCPDGSAPFAGLLQASDGNFYGTTQSGGDRGEGTVFRVTPDGIFARLYSFCAQSGCTDGGYPKAALIQGADASLYGTTVYGGAYSGGTVFKITTDGVLTTLYAFCAQSGCLDGGGPTGRLLQATDGEFYGTTPAGGAHAGGTIFKMTADGELTTIYNFCSQSGCLDGKKPYAGLIQASNGALYGTTFNGGVYGIGTIFRIEVGLDK